MRKHLIIIASIYLFLGTTTAAFFIYGHLQFFSLNPSVFSDSSVVADSSFLQKASKFYEVYRNFFAQFDINPFYSLLVIISSISFGYGLLKSKEWARKLGFLLILINVASSIYAIFSNAVSATIIIQLALAGYMWWVLTSEETKRLMKTGADEKRFAQ